MKEIYENLFDDEGTSFSQIIVKVRQEFINNIEPYYVFESLFADENYIPLKMGIVTSRKVHECNWCNTDINKKEKYFNFSVRFESADCLDTYKVCMHCAEAVYADELCVGSGILSWRYQRYNKNKAAE